jgi:hypothetical protein
MVPPSSPDFRLDALFAAIDQERQRRSLTWTALAREIGGPATGPRTGSVSTIKGLRDRQVAEGDGVLQILRWLQRTPESFVPGHPLADAPEAALPHVPTGGVLRFDAPALHVALEQRRLERHATWKHAASEIGCAPNQLTHLAAGGRVSFPGVMRILRWLNEPAARFTRITDW